MAGIAARCALVCLAKADSMLMLLQNFADAVKIQISSALLRQLVPLFGLTIPVKDMGDFLEDRYCSSEQAELIRQQQYYLLSSLRPEAVALVDNFGCEDYFLDDCLERCDIFRCKCVLALDV